MTCKQGRLQERHLIILLFGPLFFDIIVKDWKYCRIDCMHYKCTIMAGKPTFENSPTIKERNKGYGES